MGEVHLVTGAAGFLGRQTALMLTALGMKVIGVDISRPQDAGSEFEFVKGDIRDLSVMAGLVEKADVVHHQAAMVPLAKSRTQFWSVNAEATRSLARLARESEVKHFIYTSSSAVFGKLAAEAIVQTTPTHPMEAYGKSKLAGEKYCQSELRDSECKLSIVRPRTILGRSRGGIFHLFFDWVASNRPIFTIGRGDNLFQFVHVDDFLSAYQLITTGANEGFWNIGAPEVDTLKNSFIHLVRGANSESQIVSLPDIPSRMGLATIEKIGLSPLAPYHRKAFHRSFFFDISALIDIGWQPRLSSKEALLVAFQERAALSKSAQTEELHSLNQSVPQARLLSKLQRIFG